MDENSAIIEAILREERGEFGSSKTRANDDHEWKTVSYKKQSRKQPAKAPNSFSDPQVFDSGDVFRSIEQQSEARRNRALQALKAAADLTESSVSARNGAAEEGEEEDGSDGGGVENGGGAAEEVKKIKPKKIKKPKVTVSEAAAKINDSDLAAFLADITESYESQQDIQLMRFADYFGRAFASVNASQFPWMKMLKETSVAKMVDIPLSHVPEPVYKTSIEWLNQRSVEALSPFVLWSFDSILADLSLHQGNVKGSKKLVQQAPSKSQVAIFVVLAMVLRRKPDVLISTLPSMKQNSKYHGQDKLPMLLWAITQACQGDLVVGLFMWVHFLLPMMSSKSSCNPQSRDLILQLVERIVSMPKARIILVNGSVRKGERLVPPSALELLMRATFPVPSARVKATERFEAVYPLLKEVALAISPGSKAMKQITQQILPFAAKAAGEGNPALASEASDLFIWCLTQNPDCYMQWDTIYLDNLEASVVILRKLSLEWKVHSFKHPTLDSVKVALKSFRDKNENGLASGNAADAARLALFKDADKYCKMVSGKLSRGRGCMKAMMVIIVGVALGATFLPKDHQSWDLKKLLNYDLSQSFAAFSL